MMSPAPSAVAVQQAEPSLDLLLLVDWLPPDFGAIGQYALQFAEARAAEGARVCVVGFSSTGSSIEARAQGTGHLSIVRLHRQPYDKQRLIARAWWTARANLHLLSGARRQLRQAREVIFTGSPPFLLHFIAPLKPFVRGKIRYRIADFHPECLIAARQQRSWTLGMIERLTWFWRRRMDVLEIISEDQRTRLTAGGVAPERIELRRDRSPVSFAGAAPASIPEPLSGKRIILYSGNWGVAHDADTFLAGLHLLSENERSGIGLWLNATGARVAQVEAGATALGITVHQTAPCPLDALPGVLLAADLHLITLADAFVGLVLPSKIYACLDSGRPLLFIGSSCSDVHTLAAESRPSGTYWRAGVGDAAAVAASIRAMLGASG